MVASAFPLAEVALRAADERSAEAASGREAREGKLPTVDDLPFIPSEDASTSDPSSVPEGTIGPGGSSSRPADATPSSQVRAGASGSVILGQILGAAETMGHRDLVIPELPVDKLSPTTPLRSAILGWVAATGAIVPPDELARELLRADAMPIEIQRDVALLLVAATEATLLQRAALADLTPAEIAWIHAHPEVGEDLVMGVENDDTRRLAYLAAKVDVSKSIVASLLLLKAVEATRGSLSQHQAAATIDKLHAEGLDETSLAVLELLATARGDASDKEKVLLAARLVALASGVEVPPAGPAPTFAAAMQELLAATQLTPDASALAQAQTRADALPADLSGAIARLLRAEAAAVRAADPAHLTPTSQAEALVAVLVETAEALPVLQKYGFYWAGTPDALRVTEWEPAARVGWAAHHAALLVTASGDITDVVRVAPILSGHDLAPLHGVPERSFVDAYLAVSKEARFKVTDTMIADLTTISARLDPAVRDAAAILLSGAAESARLHREAFALLTPEEQRFLREETAGLSALYAGPLSDEDLARLGRATALSHRVDADKLAAAGVVATLATVQARRVLEGADAFTTQSAVTHVAAGLRGLFERFLPLAPAQAQAAVCTEFDGIGRICPGSEDDIILRLEYPTVATSGFTPGEYVAYLQMRGGLPPPPFGDGSGDDAFSCDSKECLVYDPNPGRAPGAPAFFQATPGEATRDLLIISGTDSGKFRPALAPRTICSAVDGSLRPDYRSCRQESAARYGAATIHLDLGGDDTYDVPVAMVHANASLPVSLHLDLAGDDDYRDPSGFYDGYSPILRDLGTRAGHPTQASAVYGGVAVLLDVQGGDRYSAPTRSQAYGRLGSALLADLGGRDVYVGRDFVQGASGETFTLGSAILYDAGDNDDYTAGSGQGFGLGGILLDVGGKDVYRNAEPAIGIPVVRLDIIPGGDVVALDERADDRVWLAGPGGLDLGIGIDQEPLITTSDSDQDGWPDLAEFLAGTDPKDPTQDPESDPTIRAAAVVRDSDGDGYFDYIERALSTDPENGASYPAGFPAGVSVRIPGEAWPAVSGLPLGIGQFIGGSDGRISPSNALGDTTGSNFTGSDKIIDLRLPIQDAGTLEHACTGEYYPNATLPLGIGPGANVFRTIVPNESQDGGPIRDANNNPIRRCLYVSYTPTGPGEGNATVQDPNAVTGQDGVPFTYRFPAGILAVGDVVTTNYTDDYFVVIDLGGADDHWNSAGGALAVTTTPTVKEGQSLSESQKRVQSSFNAPGLAVGIDLPSNADIGATSSKDRYWNSSRDYAHGSYFGVLIDTSGDDSYISGGGSQGSIGGILLDLEGRDTYVAGHLSQGAGLGATSAGAVQSPGNPPAKPVRDLPGNGQISGDQVSGSSVYRAPRRALPGILLDLTSSAAGNTYDLRGSHGQGFARGYANAAPNSENAPYSYGILASIGDGSDRYLAQGGRYAQGVGGIDGVGILFDRAGHDEYDAWSFTSQGATISQVIGTQDPAVSSAPHPATGILVDLGGEDTYSGANQSRAHRSDNLTVHRSETARSPDAGRVFLDHAIHLDAESSDPLRTLSALAGAGSAGFVDTEQFYVHMPTARLAVGKEGPTVYDREFAFVIDLGGDNVYKHNAGGFVRDIVGEYYPSSDVELPTSQGARVTLFPVSLVLDAGLGNSTYVSPASHTQGSGFFSVGVVADLGGKDVFRVTDAIGHALSSAWIAPAPAQAPPIIDANIADDWAGITAHPIKLTALNDSRFAHDWHLRVANDGEFLYLGLTGKTRSSTTSERLLDELYIDLDMGRRYAEWDYAPNRTGIDQVRVYYNTLSKECAADDRGWNDRRGFHGAAGFRMDVVQSGGLKVGCRFTEEGDVVYEIRKRLVTDVPSDPFDLGYCYDEVVGFGYAAGARGCTFPADELGLFLRFMDKGAGHHGSGGTAQPFTWPPGAVDRDGAPGYAFTGNLTEEMRDWAAIGLGQAGAHGRVPTHAKLPILAQGAGLAGVGIVALLGTGLGETSMHAGERTQGYGAFGGLGAVIDIAGSDLYDSLGRSLGAAQNRGFGLFVDLDGNDNYLARERALGWSANVTDGSSAIFLDLAGDDDYRYVPKSGQRIQHARSALSGADQAVPIPEGNNVIWLQNRSIGADYRIRDLVHNALASATVQSLFGQTRTWLNITEYDPADPQGGPWKNGCTTRSVATVGTEGWPDFADAIVRGKVCFVATVNTGNGVAAQTLGPSATIEGLLKQLESVTGSAGLEGDELAVAEVLSVDFLVDRKRVATSYVRQDLGETLSRWSAVVDLAEHRDGVSRGKALPLFTTKIGDLGAFLFHDEVSNNINETNQTRATRVLLIDNPPAPKVSLEPPYTGKANATFSPNAYGAHQKLLVKFAVGHDVGEDRYAQHNEFRPSVANTSIPCQGIPAPDAQNVRLCNILPFYLGADGAMLTTTPGDDPGIEQENGRFVPSPARMQVEFLNSTFDAHTPELRTPLRIERENSFHLALPGRLALQPTREYNTQIEIFLERTDGKNVLDATGGKWFIGDKLGKGGKEEDLPLSGEIYGAIDDANRDLTDAIDLLNGDNLARAAVDAVYLTACADYGHVGCRQVTGRPGQPGAFDLCAPTPPANNLVGQQIWTAWRAANPTLAQNVPDEPGVRELRRGTCASAFQILNETTDEHGGATGSVADVLSTVAGAAVGAANSVLSLAGLSEVGGGDRVNGINFSDFYFDVNKTLPSQHHCWNGECVRFEGDVLVVPPGFKLKMEFRIPQDDDCLGGLCQAWDQIFEGLANDLGERMDQVNDTAPVNVYNPLEPFGVTNFDPYHTEVERRLRDQNGDLFASASQANVVPLSVFPTMSGPPKEQARLEIRVPSEPSTDISVTVQDAKTGEAALILRESGRLAGDIAGTPTRDGGSIDASTWYHPAITQPPQVDWKVTSTSARWTEHTIKYSEGGLPDGLYRVVVSATDQSGQRVLANDTLLVDSTPPASFVTTDLFTGRGTLQDGAIPVRWSVFEQGSGLNWTYLYIRDGVEGDIRDNSTWKRVPEPFPAEKRFHLKSKNPLVDTYLFMTISVDRAHNVEGIVHDPEQPLPNLTAALDRAFHAKIARGENVGYRRVLLDQGDPAYQQEPTILGARLVNFEGSEFAFTRAGVPITFSICAVDEEDAIGRVRLNLDRVDPLTGVLTGIGFNATPTEPCGEGGTLFNSTEWHLVNEDQTRFPEGVYTATFDIFDRAGNRLPVAAGNVILDHRSPDVTLQPPVLPVGQSAVKPGDLVKIRLLATDDYGVDESGIRVDASSFAKGASDLRTRPARVNGVVYQEASFTVDRPDIQNGVFNVTVKVPDNAGNYTTVETHIAVNFKPFEFVAGSLRVSNVTHNAATLHWKTTEPTSAFARYGTDPARMTSSQPIPDLATEHSLRVEGLVPRTHYLLQAVAVSAGGSEKRSEIVEIDTGSALFLSAISPRTGDKVSGLAKIKFRGGLLDSTDFVSYTLEVRDGPSKAWTFVTTATRQGDEHELNWNSSRFLDGSNYELKLSAKAGRDEASIVIGKITSDNTPPSVLVLGPLLATNDTTPLLTAEAGDALSGLASSPPTLLVDGVVVATPSGEALPGGRMRYTYAFQTPLAAGARTFELRVADAAGNVAVETWRVTIDGDAPVITVNPTRYSPGTAAAKSGGTVTLNLTLDDLSGVAHVVADMSSLNPAANETRLVKLVGTDEYQATIRVTSGEDSASKLVVVRAVDLAGNTRVTELRIPLDNVAPRVDATSLREVRHRSAVIEVPADEPILVNGTATAAASPAVTAATSEATRSARLVFDGLLPSRTYAYKLTVVDRAGNPVDLAGRFATQDDVLPPSDVGPLSVLDLLNGTLRLSWTPATDDVLVSHYRVYRSEDGVQFRVIAETQANVYEDWGLPYEKSYTYKVAAVDFGANEGGASPSLRASATAVPHLTVGAVTPTVGTSSTIFRYSVTYLSPGGLPPAYVRVILDGVPQNMTLESGDAKTGAVYVYETRLTPHKRDAPHTYAFETSDGRYTVRFPDDGSVVRGPLVSGGVLADAESGAFASFAQRVPLGGVAGLGLALVAAVGVAALLRRKKEGSK